MSIAHVLTVGGAAIDSGDPAGCLVARALLGEGRAVASRQVVDEDEAALERALEAAMVPGALVVILASPGGSGGDIVRRTLARAAGTRLVLNETLLARIEQEFARRELSMPHRLDRLGLRHVARERQRFDMQAGKMRASVLEPSSPQATRASTRRSPTRTGCAGAPPRPRRRRTARRCRGRSSRGCARRFRRR